jgi:hypothetical protein
MTITMLMSNTVKAALLRRGKTAASTADTVHSAGAR